VHLFFTAAASVTSGWQPNRYFCEFWFCA